MDKDIRGTLEGLLAQITTHVILHTQTAPLERIKILLQTQQSISGINYQNQYTGVKDCMGKIRYEEGDICFWRGNLAGILREGSRFTSNFTLSGFFLSKGSTRTLKAIVDIIGMSVAYPLDVARVKLATDVKGEYIGVEDSLLEIFSRDGFQGIYAGWEIGIIHSIIKTISMTYTNKIMNFIVDKITKDASLRLLLKFIFRPFANIAALTIAYPLEVIKNLVIVHAGRNDVMPLKPYQCFKDIILTEGWRGLYQGILAEVLLTYISSLPFEELEANLKSQIWRLIRKYF